MQVRRVIAIQNYGSSGTLLLQSLLDGHPEILSLPALHALHLYQFWECYGGETRETILGTFLSQHEHWFANVAEEEDIYGLQRLGENGEETAAINREAFFTLLAKHWHSLPALTRKEFISSVYLGHHLVSGKPYPASAVLVFPIHSAEKKYARQLVEDFGEVRFLHMVREPVLAFGSLAKHIENHPQLVDCPLLECCASQLLFDEMRHFGPRKVHGFERYFPDSGTIESRALRLEDVHTRVKPCMEALCGWIGIAWDECLLMSTFQGKLWHNRRESLRQSGVGEGVIRQHYADYLSAFDRKRLQALTAPQRRAFGYAQAKEDGAQAWLAASLWLPFRMELRQKLKHYRETRRLLFQALKKDIAYDFVPLLAIAPIDA